jgi:hypothetical protein
MCRVLPCVLALFAFGSLARADELDRESAPKQSPAAIATTVTAASHAVGTELDQESPAAAYHWHGGWGGYHHGGYGGFGGGWGYRPFYNSGFYGGFGGFGGFGRFGGGFGGGFGGFGYRPFYTNFYRPYFGGFYNYGFSPFGLYNSWYW